MRAMLIIKYDEHLRFCTRKEEGSCEVTRNCRLRWEILRRSGSTMSFNDDTNVLPNTVLATSTCVVHIHRSL